MLLVIVSTSVPFVINSITPDVRLPTILMGALPFGACMVVALLIPCILPGLATWLPTVLMG